MSEAYKDYALEASRRVGKLEAELKSARQDAQAELLEACEAMIRWDDAEKAAKPFDDDNGAGFYARMDMCAEAFRKARLAVAKARGEQA